MKLRLLFRSVRSISIFCVCCGLLSPLKVTAQSNVRAVSFDELKAMVALADWFASTPEGKEYGQRF